MGHAGDAYALGGIVDGVDHAPVACPYALLVFVTFELLASRGPGIVCQRENLAVNAGEHRVIKRVKLLLCGWLDFDEVASHATGGA